MKYRTLFLIVALGVMAALLLASHEGSASKQIQVVVSILPQKYFVRQIAGDRVHVSVLVPPGANPAVYEPTPAQMKALSQAAVYFTVGVPFERTWLPRIRSAFPDLRLVATDREIRKRMLPRHVHGQPEQAAQATGSEGEKGFPDPHVWLAPHLVEVQARAIFKALADLDPDHAAVYEANYRRFTLDLVDLDLELQRRFRAVGQANRFVVFHPSWGYFAHAYGLRQWAIELEGKEARAPELKRLMDDARSLGVKTLFVQPQFAARSPRVVAQAIGAELVPLDPLAEDWADNLRAASRRIKEALR
ncbi:zinc transport system substrate-binding protein [Desulfacinum hydrothermale DSM 13146]|uniref:Zinc transport system substrate-binding protein n=1 Tax=Desulfacinum hydrothermale DSM 13146 TaxID=1121390 RepID=A0A1W1XIS2_9BACT|nr:zinc ABC transporter substrate-binding protein [Desulfacinum hydrothermale]SMC23722.1 zinc transport system substrate-binding protein [Desulfacinum hydrothermale DSM 13146]